MLASESAKVTVTWPEGYAATLAARGERPLVYDCFPFFNELDILEIRLNELSEAVDFFVIAEAGETFQGQPKPRHLRENLARFAAFRDRIILIDIEDFSEAGDGSAHSRGYRSAGWGRNFFQKEALMAGLSDARPLDWVLYSDLDEIPRGEIVRGIARSAENRRLYWIFEHGYYENKLNWETEIEGWCGTRMIERRFLRSIAGLRRMRHAPHQKALLPLLDWRLNCMMALRALVLPQRVPGGGWHFSGIGEAERVLDKVQALVKNQLGDGKSPDEMLAEMQANLAAGRTHRGHTITRRRISRMPAHVQDNRERFAALLDDGVDAAPLPGDGAMRRSQAGR